MNETEVHSLLEEHGAIKHGHFKLSSGKHSDLFVQSAAVLPSTWPFASGYFSKNPRN